MDKKLEFDRRLFLSLKEEYRKAVEHGLEQFSLQGHVFVTGYAKYLIQHLSPIFEKDKKI